MNIKTFGQIAGDDISLVGGKGTSLGIMTRAGIPVPPGFIITTEVYKNFFSKPLPSSTVNEILRAFDSMETERVAVRSSAAAEDSISSSWAGQLETYLNVTRDNLVDSIQKCWDSILSERAKSYAQRQGLSANNPQVAVVIQKMISSEKSGVLFTANPVTKNLGEIVLEATYGLGELLAQGMVTPYNYILDKRTLEVKSKSEGEQETMLIYQKSSNQVIPIPISVLCEEILSPNDIKSLATLALQIEDIYKYPQDIEWAIEANKIYILQSRPISTL